jgi:hypothetical protein
MPFQPIAQRQIPQSVVVRDDMPGNHPRRGPVVAVMPYSVSNTMKAWFRVT